MRVRRNLIAFADIVLLRCIIEYERVNTHRSIPIRRLMQCANDFIDLHHIPEATASRVTGMSRVQKGIRLWTELGILKPASGDAPNRKQHWFRTTDRSDCFWTDLFRLYGTHWRHWPLEVPIIYTDDGPTLDWGNALTPYGE